MGAGISAGRFNGFIPLSLLVWRGGAFTLSPLQVQRGNIPAGMAGKG